MKKNTSIRVEPSVLTKAKDLNLPIQKICRDALNQAVIDGILSSPQEKPKKDKKKFKTKE